jgi:hypothetical protein
LWAQLIEWQGKTWRSFRLDYSVSDLEEKFEKEEQVQQMDLWGCAV